VDSCLVLLLRVWLLFSQSWFMLRQVSGGFVFRPRCRTKHSFSTTCHPYNFRSFRSKLSTKSELSMSNVESQGLWMMSARFAQSSWIQQITCWPVGCASAATLCASGATEGSQRMPERTAALHSVPTAENLTTQSESRERAGSSTLSSEYLNRDTMILAVEAHASRACFGFGAGAQSSMIACNFECCEKRNEMTPGS
jgi:hypothetical protein